MNKINEEVENKEEIGFILNMISKLPIEILEVIIWILTKLFNIRMALIEEAEENAANFAVKINKLEYLAAKKFLTELNKYK